MTGVAFDGGPEIEGKRLELLKAVPTISGMAMLMGNIPSETREQEESAARALGLTLRYFYVRQPGGILGVGLPCAHG